MLLFKILVNGLDGGKPNILRKSADIAGIPGGFNVLEGREEDWHSKCCHYNRVEMAKDVPLIPFVNHIQKTNINNITFICMDYIVKG